MEVEMSDAPAPSGIYRPIPGARGIRLVELLAGAASDPIRVRLASVPLDGAPPYDAVSYVWGNSYVQSVPIRCEAETIAVTPNLHWALQRTRLPSSNRLLWIDAICINQGDMRERSTQVAFMGAIYARADRVLICMGEPPTAGAAAMVAQLLQLVGSAPGSLLVPGAGAAAWARSLGWPALAQLMGQPWFQRAWVLQEVGMAREPVVLYGREQFPYPALVDAVRWARQQPSLLAFGIGSLRIHVEWLYWRSWGQDPARRGMEEGKTFYDLVDHASLLLCRDPRDHVYAFLGHPLAQRPDGGGLVIAPDYTKGVKQLYLEFSVVSLNMVGLRALVTVEHNEDSLVDGFPSWVNRWYIRGTTNNISRMPEQVYSAGGQLDSASRPWVDRWRLMLRGGTVDTLWKCFRFLDTYLDVLASQLTVVDAENPAQRLSLGELCRLSATHNHPSIYGPDSGSRLNALSATLCASRPFENPRQHVSSLSSILQAAGAASSSIQMNTDDPSTRAALLYSQRLISVVSGRSFAISQRGRYCLVPQTAKPGDQICVVRGLDVPMVMRPAEGGRKLLGESYVQGLMEGQAMEMVQNGELAEEVLAVV